jgi:hypothetical protein
MEAMKHIQMNNFQLNSIKISFFLNLPKEMKVLKMQRL